MTAPRHQRGVWYLWLAALSGGFFAFVPFWHAAGRLQRADVRRWAIGFTAVTVYLVVLMVLTPDRNPDGTRPDSVVSTIGGFSALTAAVVAVVRLNGLRREVYAAPVAPVLPPKPASVDPAIAAVLAGRRKRAEARELLGRDRSMARELGIGRPDLGRGFDDGGLVDLNGAPAPVIAQRCDLTPEQASAVVAAREARAGYFAVDEVFIDVPLPADAADRVRERAFV